MRRGRVLIASDSVLSRRLLRDAIASSADLDVVATVPSTLIAVQAIAVLTPDVIVIQFDSANDGIDAVEQARTASTKVHIILCVSSDDAPVETTLRALGAGAAAAVSMPTASTSFDGSSALSTFTENLLFKLLALTFGRAVAHASKMPDRLDSVPSARRDSIRLRLPGSLAPTRIGSAPAKQLASIIPTRSASLPAPAFSTQASLRAVSLSALASGSEGAEAARLTSMGSSLRAPGLPSFGPPRRQDDRPPPSDGKSMGGDQAASAVNADTTARALGLYGGARSAVAPFEILAIGCSTGGPNTLAEIFRTLTPDLNVPILIVQHMPPMFTRLLAERLTAESAFVVTEATHGELIQRNRVYIAPGDYHMAVVRDATGSGVRIALNQGPKEGSCRPAVDVLFRSIARVYGSRVLAVVLTGMGRDGALGAASIVDAGGTVVIQDPASCVIASMPRAVAAAGLASGVIALEQMATELTLRIRSR